MAIHSVFMSQHTAGVISKRLNFARETQNQFPLRFSPHQIRFYGPLRACSHDSVHDSAFGWTGSEKERRSRRQNAGNNTHSLNSASKEYRTVRAAAVSMPGAASEVLDGQVAREVRNPIFISFPLRRLMSPNLEAVSEIGVCSIQSEQRLDGFSIRRG